MQTCVKAKVLQGSEQVDLRIFIFVDHRPTSRTLGPKGANLTTLMDQGAFGVPTTMNSWKADQDWKDSWKRERKRAWRSRDLRELKKRKRESLKVERLKRARETSFWRSRDLIQKIVQGSFLKVERLNTKGQWVTQVIPSDSRVIRSNPEMIQNNPSESLIIRVDCMSCNKVW